MPVHRTQVAADGADLLERVSAPAHGPAWGAAHQASQWRCILPGAGLVQWRSGGESVFVDALTAFRLRPGEVYQLQHEVPRVHDVYCRGAHEAAPGDARAWLVRPRELFALQRAVQGARSGRLSVGQAGALVQRALADALPLATPAVPSLAARARHALARHGAGVGVQALAEELRCSPYHLMRQFRREVGLSVHQYRLHLRIALALQRLQAGERDLAGLAHDLGFCSQSHLGEVMRRLAGCTPREARGALA